MTETPKLPKKKHNWMKYFVIPKATSDIDKIRYESVALAQDRKNKLINKK